MPVPPPPPPPPLGPPPPPPPPNAALPKCPSEPPKLKSGGGGGGRNALLADIQKGARLKKVTQVSDRSAPAVDKPTASAGDVSSSVGASQGSSGGMAPVIPSLGGLFAGGFPTLRPTGQRDLAGKTSVSRSSSSASLKPLWNPPTPADPSSVSEPPGTGELRGSVRRPPPASSSAPSSPSHSSKHLPFFPASSPPPPPPTPPSGPPPPFPPQAFQDRPANRPPPPLPSTLPPPPPKVAAVPSPAMRSLPPSYPCNAPTRRPPAVPRSAGVPRLAPPPAPPARYSMLENEDKMAAFNCTFTVCILPADDFESKFQFHPVEDFPPPDDFKPFPRIYPSKENRGNPKPPGIRTPLR
ncbi:WAS/WASL-interacting protein family member 3 [Etheostoma cragini]|uniref:WAS/WASL-interacting protein family member 3 n=1 Tax=Etheostoma cragini TaxID=417921 RepID=UPI00155EDCA3|nr:WAS/WASL-interacting protein family member 3 [Etheostoma cragini]